MSEPRALVEHFFRHEFGRLGAVLTRSLGVRRLDLVDDVVQAALVQALETWSRLGVPEEPAGWLYRTARNLAIDALRPVPAESRVALALRTLCGFSTAEIARALLATEVNIQKRIERARERLRQLDVEFDTPDAAQLGARLDVVLAVVYLLFSQGCHVTHGDLPIRRDLCDEARRLARMLAAHPVGDVPAVHSLLALMCFHGARFDARIALDGAIVLLEEQDRSAWNWSDVREGMEWFARSAAGDELTRYHVEAAIAWEHCRAPTFADTDWWRMAELYDTLERIAPSPLNSLNRAVVEAYLHGPQAGLERLAAVPPECIPARYPGWQAVIGELEFRLGRHAAAERAWRGALRLTTARAEREFLQRRLAACPQPRNETAMSQLFRFPSSVKRDPTIEVWMHEHSGELGAIAQRWFEVMRDCGDDVRELLHDGHPTACVGDAAFAYVNAFSSHVNVGFFRGAEIADPEGLLEGTGKFMRHVKLWPDRDVDATALEKLIETAYADMKARLKAE
jgi:RNA polymerase sigma-70 factor (ECF subfamily)